MSDAWFTITSPLLAASPFWLLAIGAHWIKRESRRMAQRRVIEDIRFQCLAYGRCSTYAGKGN